MPHNEITGVQVPALMHLAKLGYDFIPTNSKPNLDTATNILRVKGVNCPSRNPKHL